MMKRRALKLLLFLLAGAIINIAVAWWCAVRPSPIDFSWQQEVYQLANGHSLLVFTRQFGDLGVHFSEPRDRFRSATNVELPEFERLLPSWSQYRAVRQFSNPDDISAPTLSQQANGWPLLSMRFWTIIRLSTNPINVTSDDHGLLSLPIEATSPNGRRARVPLIPIWPGFAINTIFYAALLWVLFAVPVKVRRWRRIKRAQCASCGYSLRGTPHIEKCPECGATLKQKADTQKA